MDIYYVDGKFLPADQAMIPVDDLAVLRGLGAFELLRTYKGQPFALQAHLDRLAHSSEKIGLQLPCSLSEIARIVMETLARNRDRRHAESNIRIIVTGGSSPDFMTLQGRPRLLVLVSELPAPPPAWYTGGVKITTMHSRRVLPGAKSINYLSATVALKRARELGAVESAYVDHEGLVYECTTSNIFAFVGQVLVTPGRKMLAGITRGVVLELARTMYPVEVRDLKFSELTAAEEVFITGTNKGVVPVVQIDDVVIGDGKPGARTLAIRRALESRVWRQIESQAPAGGEA